MSIVACYAVQSGKLGAEGDVEEAQAVMTEVEELEKERERERANLMSHSEVVSHTPRQLSLRRCARTCTIIHLTTFW